MVDTLREFKVQNEKSKSKMKSQNAKDKVKMQNGNGTYPFLLIPDFTF